MTIIFDMDGVVLDSNPFHKKVWQQFMADFDVEVTDEIFKNIISGTTGKEAVKKLMKEDISDEQAKEYTSQMDAQYREDVKGSIKPLNGLISFLDDIMDKRLKYCLATSAPPENIELVLENTRLNNYFSVIINRTHVVNGKPHPDIYLKAAEVLEVDPKECVVFEDSLAGIAAAINAGMKVIGVTTTHNEQELTDAGAAFAIDDFTGISLSKIDERIFKS